MTFKGSQTIEIPKCCSTLGIAIEGGTNTQQTLPRIISIQPTGAAYQNCDLRVGQLISEVDGFKLSGKYKALTYYLFVLLSLVPWYLARVFRFESFCAR